MKQRHDRIGFARAAIENLVPLVRERGTLQVQEHMSECIEFVSNGLTIFYSPAFNNLTLNVRPRQVLDIWAVGGQKVFSVEWDPMVIIAFRPGLWLEQARMLFAGRILH